MRGRVSLSNSRKGAMLVAKKNDDNKGKLWYAVSVNFLVAGIGTTLVSDG